MINFFIKKSPLLKNLILDMHNHILPGIDDGAVDVEESEKMRYALNERGIDTCIFTPHIFKEFYPNNEDTIYPQYDLLKNSSNFHNDFPNDRYAAEYMVDHNFYELLETGAPLLCIKDKKVLIEFSSIMMPINYEEIIFKLRVAGYTPIIAHPERYLYLSGNVNYEKVNSLKDMGCEFQLNLLALNGNYGKYVTNFAIKLLKENLYDYSSTDIHHYYQIVDLDKLLYSSTWKKWSSYPFKNIDLL